MQRCTPKQNSHSEDLSNREGWAVGGVAVRVVYGKVHGIVVGREPGVDVVCHGGEAVGEGGWRAHGRQAHRERVTDGATQGSQDPLYSTQHWIISKAKEFYLR